MADPDALPVMIEWRVGAVVLRTQRAIGKDNLEHTKPAVKKNTLRHHIPVGADGWRFPGEMGWRALDTLHAAWALEPLSGPVEDEDDLTEEELAEVMDRKVRDWVARQRQKGGGGG